MGKWSIPGGKIELGETTIAAAKREAYEETNIEGCHWHPTPFMTTDAIFQSPWKKEEGVDNDKDCSIDFHYVISHCFATVRPASDDRCQEFPAVAPSEDALDAKWMSLMELREVDQTGMLSSGVVDVIERAEELHRLGALRTF